MPKNAMIARSRAENASLVVTRIVRRERFPVARVGSAVADRLRPGRGTRSGTADPTIETSTARRKTLELPASERVTNRRSADEPGDPRPGNVPSPRARSRRRRAAELTSQISGHDAAPDRAPGVPLRPDRDRAAARLDPRRGGGGPRRRRGDGRGARRPAGGWAGTRRSSCPLARRAAAAARSQVGRVGRRRSRTW